MCCRNRRRGQYPRQSKGVLLAMATQMAREIYQKHQASRGIASTTSATVAFESEAPTTQQNTKTAFLQDEKVDMAPPPSYNEVVVNRADIPEPLVSVDEKGRVVPTTKGAANGDDFVDEYPQILNDREQQQQQWGDYGVANGMNYKQVPYGHGNGWEAPPVKMGCCERKRLRKAEKAARKVAEREVARG